MHESVQADGFNNDLFSSLIICDGNAEQKKVIKSLFFSGTNGLYGKIAKNTGKDIPLAKTVRENWNKK